MKSTTLGHSARSIKSLVHFIQGIVEQRLHIGNVDGYPIVYYFKKSESQRSYSGPLEFIGPAYMGGRGSGRCSPARPPAECPVDDDETIQLVELSGVECEEFRLAKF